MFSFSYRLPALLACLAFGALVQAAEPTVDRAALLEKVQRARAQWLADPEIAPLQTAFLEATAALHAARESELAKGPETVEKEAKLRELAKELATVAGNQELSDEDRAARRQALLDQLKPLATDLAAARRSVDLGDDLRPLKEKADEAQKALDAALDKKLAESPETREALAVLAAPETGKTTPVVPDTGSEPSAPAVPVPAVPEADAARSSEPQP